MKVSFALLTTILSFVYSACFSQVDQDFHIYLLFGQSNMEGMGDIEPQDTIKNPSVKVLQDFTCPELNRYYGEWYVAKPPLNRCKAGLGPADSFGRTMAESMPSNITIGLVLTAVAGTKIELFQKGNEFEAGKSGIPSRFTNGYQWLLDLAKIAQKRGVIKGILFHQGESNAGEADWKNKVQEIVEDLKKDLKLGDVPFLAGEVLYKSKGGDRGHHNVEVNKLPSIIPNCHVISARGLEGSDKFHFTSEAYRELGKRYATKMLELQE